MLSPGMPKTSAGIQAPPSAELLAAPDSTMPSTCPVPNFSGSLENFFETAYDIHAAMSAPAPGRAPTAVPSAEPRSNASGYFLIRPHMPLKTLPKGRSTAISGRSVEQAKRSTSETANMPIISGMSGMPPINSLLPKVQRGAPAGFSSPTQEISRPSSRAITPLRGSVPAMNTAQVNPSITSQKYSKELNFSAISARAGAATISTSTPKMPPSTENTRPAPSASSARPERVSR